MRQDGGGLSRVSFIDGLASRTLVQVVWPSSDRVTVPAPDMLDGLRLASLDVLNGQRRRE